MRKLRRLKLSALASCEWRGHDMERFITDFFGSHEKPHSATSYCRKCKAFVVVNTHPAPNGIDICGDAVAVDCRGKVE